MQKTAGDITLKVPVSVTNTLDFNGGIINSSATNMLAVTNPVVAAVTGSPSNASFVNGPMTRATSPIGEYVMPVGSSLVANNKYRPVTITPATATLTTYKAEYKPLTPTPNYQNQLAVNLVGVDNTETWQVDRTAGTANAVLSFDYKNPGLDSWIEPGGSFINPISNSKVAVVQYQKPSLPGYWAWTALTFTSSPVMERLYTDENPIYTATISNFTYNSFSFGLQYAIVLPVRLLAFNGRLVNTDGQLAWTIADAQTLDNFELQYSRDGRNFNRLATINNNGKTDYSYLHPSLPAGAHFYRLKVNDKSGSSFFSQIVMLTVGRVQTQIVGLQATVVRNTITPMIISSAEQRAGATLFDASGRTISHYETNLQAGPNRWPIQAPILANGIYFLHVRTADNVEKTLKMVKE
jgi:hypothetical protein